MAGVAVGGQGNESPKATRSPAAFSGAGRAVREQQRPRTRGEARPGVCEQPGGGRMKVTRGWDVSQIPLASGFHSEKMGSSCFNNQSIRLLSFKKCA